MPENLLSNGCALIRHMAPSDAASHGDRQGSPHLTALPSVKLECSQDPDHVIPTFCLDQRASW